MDITTSVTATLRAQEHGHPPIVCLCECNNRIYVSEKAAETIRAECHGAYPVICFEPGIVKRLGGNRYTSNISVTLRATMGDNQHAVSYEVIK